MHGARVSIEAPIAASVYRSNPDRSAGGPNDPVQNVDWMDGRGARTRGIPEIR